MSEYQRVYSHGHHFKLINIDIWVYFRAEQWKEQHFVFQVYKLLDSLFKVSQTNFEFFWYKSVLMPALLQLSCTLVLSPD